MGRLLAAGVLFAAIFAVRMVEADPLVPWADLYVIPIVLVAQARGRAWGLATGGLAIALVAIWAQTKGVDLGAGGYLVRTGAFLAVGWIVGADAKRSVRTGVGESSDHVLRVDSFIDAAPPSDREARRRASLKVAGLGTWELDVATGEMEWSEEYHALYGVDPRDFIASQAAFQEIVHPKDRQILNQALERIMRDGTTLEVQYRIIRPSDGAERCIRSHIHSQRDAAGRPFRVLGTGQDVTDLVMVLSPRESQMLMLLAEGLSVEDIAAELVLSPATVRTHIQNAMTKLGAHTRGEAIATALRSKEIGS